MTTLLDVLAPEPGHSRIRNGRRVKLSPDEVRSIAALIALGRRQYDIARAFGISEALVSRIGSGERWSSVTGIPSRARTPNHRHATVLLQRLAEHPESAPVVRSSFDGKFGDGAAWRTLARLLTVGAENLQGANP